MLERNPPIMRPAPVIRLSGVLGKLLKALVRVASANLARPHETPPGRRRCLHASTLERALGRRGLQVTACEDGPKALSLWQAAPPDVVVLDLSLPGLDGLEVLQLARQAGLATPVLILTARGTVGDRIVGLNSGADDYLPKPFDLDELEARLRPWLAAVPIPQPIRVPVRSRWANCAMKKRAVRSTTRARCWS